MPPTNQSLTKNAAEAFVGAPDRPFVPQESAASGVVKARPERPAPDPRREMAQMAAKARWAAWAGKKAL